MDQFGLFAAAWSVIGDERRERDEGWPKRYEGMEAFSALPEAPVVAPRARRWWARRRRGSHQRGAPLGSAHKASPTGPDERPDLE